MDRRTVIVTLLTWIRRGVTLRTAARIAGVHVAAVCRWQARDSGLRDDIAAARRTGRPRQQPGPAPRPRLLAVRLPAVPGEGGRTDAPGPAPLALRPLAAVPVGQLAAAGAAQLPPLWWPLLLVPQPQEHRLRGLRNANKEAH